MALYETLRPATHSLPTADRLVVVTSVPRGRRDLRLLNLGITEVLATAISSRTGRACEIDELGVHRRSPHLLAYGALAITLAVTDAPRPAPLPGWQDALKTLLNTVLPDIPSGTPIVVAVPVVHSSAPKHTLRARLAERRRYRLTTEVATILNTYGRGEMLALPLTADRALRTVGTPDSAERLAGSIADRLAPRLLQAGHDAIARALKLSA